MLRDQKEDVRQLLLKYEKSLKKIHEEIPPETRKKGPAIPPQKDSEHPEKQFQVILKDDEADFAEEHFMYVPQEYIQKFVEVNFWKNNPSLLWIFYGNFEKV